MAVKAVNQLDIVDLTDGYSVVLSSEAVSLLGGTTYANSATVTTTVYALCGNTQVPCSVDTTAVTFTGSHNNGITVSKDSNTTQPTLTFTVAASKVTGNCEATIPIVITDTGITLDKKFSFTVSKQGTGGTRGSVWYSGTAITGTSTTPTAFSSSGITSAVVGDMYLNTSTGNTYRCTTGGNAANAKWVYVDNLTGPQGGTGPTGAAGGRWYTGTGITGTSTNATVFTGSGVSSAVVGDMYLNTSTSNYYRCTVAGNASTAKWVYAGNSKGVKGDTGDDAILLVITSSAGTIFKNTQAVTTLTAHVYSGGVELTSTEINALGTVKWYKDDSTTVAGTGTTYSVTAGQVTNKATFIAQLES